MGRIRVAVGTARGPKLAAVREALPAIAPLLEGAETSVEIAAVDVASGVGHTPLSRAEIMTGARGRVEALLRMAREQGEPWKFCIGLEGGLEVVREGSARWVFLENWAYVADAIGQGAFGQGGAIVLPEALARRVLEDGVELAEAIDAFAGGNGIRDAHGAWGVLTRNLITRQECYRTAVINAFARFLQPRLYAASEASIHRTPEKL